ncbi:hypothetical protein Ahy_B02g058182 isoform B [Arachis hypogaea]|uniref:RRM domain-containing protein n=1 Tax=Arachis hypogaea TaxID=3818 RepID=A0A445AE29_ARAHY|nr:hypothetical protein Ahy_B02g058182 isoform B [Arachis hypogaea]
MAKSFALKIMYCAFWSFASELALGAVNSEVLLGSLVPSLLLLQRTEFLNSKVINTLKRDQTNHHGLTSPIHRCEGVEYKNQLLTVLNMNNVSILVMSLAFSTTKEKLAEAFLEYGNVLNGMFFISVSISRCEECSIMSPAERGRIVDPPMMPPYAALYSPRGVYTHPAIPIGPYPHGQGVPSSPATGTPLSMEMPPKSANSNRGLMKKLKGFEGLAMSIGNGHTDSTNLRTENKLSQSDTGMPLASIGILVEHSSDDWSFEVYPEKKKVLSVELKEKLLEMQTMKRTRFK